MRVTRMGIKPLIILGLISGLGLSATPGWTAGSAATVQATPTTVPAKKPAQKATRKSSASSKKAAGTAKQSGAPSAPSSASSAAAQTTTSVQSVPAPVVPARTSAAAAPAVAIPSPAASEPVTTVTTTPTSRGPTQTTIVTRPVGPSTAAEPEDEDNPPYIALALNIGTLGPGAELTLGIIPEYLNLRGGGNYLPLSFDGSIKDVEYAVKVKWASVPVVADWHPFGNNFRLTGGCIYNRNKADLDATPNTSVTLGDRRYTPEQVGTLSGSINFKNFAPYAGLGFGNAVGGPETTWNFVFDVGVMFQGTPAIDLESNGTLAGDPTFQADLDEEKDEIQSQANKFRFYPVLSFGISYQF